MVRRVAVLSDVHGNLPALEAVLADIESGGGADEYVMLGDFAAMGAWPAESIAHLRAVPNLSAVRGNTDRHLAMGDRPELRGATAEARERERTTLDAIFGWAIERLSDADVAYLRGLPFQQPFQLGATPALAVHASPRTDEEPVVPATPDAELAQMLAGVAARIVFLGHTHVQFDRTEPATGIRVINPGSVGAPFDGDPRAAYAIVETEADAEPRIELRRVPYDIDAAVAGLRDRGFPAVEFVEARLRQARP